MKVESVVYGDGQLTFTLNAVPSLEDLATFATLKNELPNFPGAEPEDFQFHEAVCTIPASENSKLLIEQRFRRLLEMVSSRDER